jgi:hypothetical protein
LFASLSSRSRDSPIYNIKTLLRRDLRPDVEGALTYRTIQFSKSIRRCRRKANPLRGTKNLSAD